MKAMKQAAMLLLTVVLGGLPSHLAAQQTQPAAPSVAVPVYKPPLRGAPGGRVGGGTRGTPRDMFMLTALAPDHSGLTMQEQPPLFWFISGSTSFPVELTITDPRAPRPLVETRLTSPVPAGVHAIRLADHGVRLAPGVQYRWFVAVVPDQGRRSRDILAGGTIERIDVPDALRSRVETTPREQLPFVYAEAGLWYDALATVSELIERAPGSREHRQQRSALLSQVGLPLVDEGSGDKPVPTR
ncbi:MAG TPA: DUF928 domain-containing protein [Methylomirabilota bacterium]|jgi:hypothetical protein